MAKEPVPRVRRKAKKADSALQIAPFLNTLHVGNSAEVMKGLPTGSVDLIITSPPYWGAVEYDDQPVGWPTYELYLDEMMQVWRECARVLRPNGKLCINAPVMPIPKKLIEQHTRHLKNIAFDTESRILEETDLSRYAVFVWQKQTSKMMFGSYPYPGNIIENNTIEFINVYVKPGKPPKFDAELKEANRLSRSEWIDLCQQVWFMYPEDVKRGGGHPAPFPEKLPARLMRLYSYGAHGPFAGEVVLDPFVGTGTTCAVAKSMGRQYIGVDVSAKYVEMAEQRVRDASLSPPRLMVGRAKYPTKGELMALAVDEAKSTGKKAEGKHKRKTYGRAVPPKDQAQLTLVWQNPGDKA